jgi:hypothetical protein
MQDGRTQQEAGLLFYCGRCNVVGEAGAHLQLRIVRNQQPFFRRSGKIALFKIHPLSPVQFPLLGFFAIFIIHQ